MTPTPGAVWSWPDGRLSILSPDDIARGYVVVATAFDLYGVRE